MGLGLNCIWLGDTLSPFRKWDPTKPLGDAVVLRPGQTIAHLGGGKVTKGAKLKFLPQFYASGVEDVTPSLFERRRYSSGGGQLLKTTDSA